MTEFATREMAFDTLCRRPDLSFARSGVQVAVHRLQLFELIFSEAVIFMEAASRRAINGPASQAAVHHVT